MSFSLASTMESVDAVERLWKSWRLRPVSTRMSVSVSPWRCARRCQRSSPRQRVRPRQAHRVSIENTGAALVFTVADQGKGLDPRTLPTLWRRELLRGTGRGIFLIRSFMDEVHFRQLHPGTELTLVKNWRQAGKRLEHASHSSIGGGQEPVRISSGPGCLEPLRHIYRRKCYNGNTNKEEFSWH